MKLIIFITLLFVSYQGYTQNKKNMFTVSGQVITLDEEQLIDILEKGEPLFCKYDMFLEKNDTTFYIKNMELSISEDAYFTSAYIESSIFYGENKKAQKDIHCTYLVMDDKWGNVLKIMEDEFVYLPRLSKYLDDKIKNTKPQESFQACLPVD